MSSTPSPSKNPLKCECQFDIFVYCSYIGQPGETLTLLHTFSPKCQRSAV